MSNTDANIFSEKDEGVSKIRRKKPRRNKFVTVSIIIAAAVLCLVIVYIILYKSGFRPYVRIETESGEKIKFSGMVDDSGNPIKGQAFLFRRIIGEREQRNRRNSVFKRKCLQRPLVKLQKTDPARLL